MTCNLMSCGDAGACYRRILLKRLPNGKACKGVLELLEDPQQPPYSGARAILVIALSVGMAGADEGRSIGFEGFRKEEIGRGITTEV